MRAVLPVLAALCLAGCGQLPFYPVVRDDPRFQECGGNADVLAAFPMHAADYADHFPALGRAPELDIDADAFAVVHGPDWVPGTFGGAAPKAEAGTRYVCVYVGLPPNGVRNVYGPVDITDIRP